MIPQFHTELETRAIPPNRWLLLIPLVYTTDLVDPPTIRVPDGFDTDLASIPRALRWLIDVNGRHRKAAVLHDWIYSLAGSTGLDRAVCDRIFKEAMLSLGVSRWRVNLMYAGVRVGGRKAWKRHKKALQVKFKNRIV